MAEKGSKAAVTDATDKLAEQASKDGDSAEKAKNERAEAEKKVTQHKR